MRATPLALLLLRSLDALAIGEGIFDRPKRGERRAAVFADPAAELRIACAATGEVGVAPRRIDRAGYAPEGRVLFLLLGQRLYTGRTQLLYWGALPCTASK